MQRVQPPLLDPSQVYRGSEPPDPALADRFAFVVEVSRWQWLTEDQQIQVILTGDQPVSPVSAVRLREAIAGGRRLLAHLSETHGRQLAYHVRALVQFLAEARIPLSPRRAATLLRNIPACRRRSHAESARSTSSSALGDPAGKSILTSQAGCSPDVRA